MREAGLQASPYDELQEDISRFLYPSSRPYRKEFLDVGAGHQIYFEESGRLDGVPLVILHGGPGSGSSPVIRRFFDPEYFRIFVFDQRGAGRSRPAGCLEENTTPHLVGDIERLREHLELDRWLICGGSWGATLALAYGIAHPERCRGFLLRSVALGRAAEFRWWSERMRLFFPEAWQAFADHVTEDERQNLLTAYQRRFSSEDRRVREAAALQWLHYEGACSSLFPTKSRKLQDASIDQLINMAKIEAHYFTNNAFLEENWILRNKSRLAEIPAVIVHGRYDVICPPLNAYELADGWPAARLRVVAASGHSFMEPPLASAFRDEADRARDRLTIPSLAADGQNGNA